MKMIVEKEVLDRVTRYLIGQPFAHVAQLVAGLSSATEYKPLMPVREKPTDDA